MNTDAGLTGWGDGNFGGDRLVRNPELVIGRSRFEVETIFDDLRPPAAAQHDRGEATSVRGANVTRSVSSHAARGRKMVLQTRRYQSVTGSFQVKEQAILHPALNGSIGWRIDQVCRLCRIFAEVV